MVKLKNPKQLSNYCKIQTLAVDKQTGRIQSRRGGPQSDSNLFELLIIIQHPTKKFPVEILN